jgi:hypothetical protein
LAYQTYDRLFPGLGFERAQARMQFAVYVLVDPRDSTVRYVGQTSNWRHRRVQHHGPGGALTWPMAYWKVELHTVGKLPLFAVVDTTSRLLIDRLEKRWIAYYRALGDLFNMDAGGGRVDREMATMANAERRRKLDAANPAAYEPGSVEFSIEQRVRSRMRPHDIAKEVCCDRALVDSVAETLRASGADSWRAKNPALRLVIPKR